MSENIESSYTLISKKESIDEFIKENDNTLEILTAIRPLLESYFPDSKLSLEISDDIVWSSERKLLVNVSVCEEMFFNEMLSHFNDIYEHIDSLREDIICPIVLFPNLSNENYDRMSYDCAINLVARSSYFNSDFDKNLQREMTIREIPKSQQVEEIIEYCEKHPQPDFSDIVFDLQLDLFDVDEIIDELKENGMDLNVKF